MPVLGSNVAVQDTAQATHVLLGMFFLLFFYPPF
jgi:hypothetical protein